MWRYLLILLLIVPQAYAAEVYQTREQFIEKTFSGEVPAVHTLWLKGELAKGYEGIMGHPPMQLRMRYWSVGARTVWILDAIGKERPITAGFVVADGRMESARVLAFRESRGWEIRYPFFTRQFTGVALSGPQQLDRAIDGITGATLSVRAMTRMARLALYLEQERPQ